MASVMINISERDYGMLVSATLYLHHKGEIDEAVLLNRICRSANAALAGQNPMVRASRKMGSTRAAFHAEGPLDTLFPSRDSPHDQR